MSSRTTRSLSRRKWWSLPLVAAATLLLAACGGSDTPQPAPTTAAGTPTAAPATATTTAAAETPAYLAMFEGVPGIVDHTNLDWPRQVEGLNGIVTIAAQPQRIHTTSVGFDEITAGLVSVDRFAAVGNATKNTNHSNIADLVTDVPAIGRDPEQIASVDADLVVASPNRDADFIRALESVEVTVIQLELREGAEGRIQTILLLGYLYGEEERAVELARETEDRAAALAAVIASIEGASENAPHVMYVTKYAENITASAIGSTAEAITLAAGAVCAPCEAGLNRYPQIGLETLIELDPDVIAISMPEMEGNAFRDELLSTPALAELIAIREGRVYVVPGRLHTTLSYENIRGAEQLAALLWPEHFPEEYRETPPAFSLPAQAGAQE